MSRATVGVASLAKFQENLANLVTYTRIGHLLTMAVPLPEFTPVRSVRGRIVHAAMLFGPGKTACGRKPPKKGWRVYKEPLGCRKCKVAVFYPVGRRRRKK